MIQELLGASSKIHINGTILQGTPTSSPSPSSSSTTTTSTTNSPNPENLRCPRCDSSNTKFCYYNNYNLTQPRHFCKTCRRYWTKGGALRNVPIGGGCRKNRNNSAVSKMKTVVSEIGRSGFDHHEVQSSPILWTTSSPVLPQSSPFLSLLTSTAQNPNSNTFSNSVSVKEEMSLLGSQVMKEPNARTLGLDLVNPFWKNNQHQAQQYNNNNNNNNNNGFLVGEIQNTGIQQLYQWLKSSSSNYYDSSAVILGNVASSSSSSSILETAPVTGVESGYQNPVFTSSIWSDLPTTNGAYP